MIDGYAKDQPQGFLNRVERVAIIGAGGRIGANIAEQIIRNGNHILTVIARPDSTNKQPESAQVIRVDYNSAEDNAQQALTDSLKGQQAVIITMSVGAPRDTVSKLVRTAIAAGVSYIMPNWIGHDSTNDTLVEDSLLMPLRDGTLELFKGVPDSAYFFLICNFWYEFSLAGGPNRYGFDFHKRTLVLLDGGNIQINTTTWPQCGRAIAYLLSLKQLPEDENDTSPTLSQFRNKGLYISSFRVSQLDMFASVKRVTGTTDADWTITHESAEQRWKDASQAVRGQDWSQFTKQLYSRMFFADGGGAFDPIHNKVLNLPGEDLDEYTAVAIRMAENNEVPFGH